MTSIILTLVIFAFFTVVGYAAVLLAARRPDGSSLLLSPVIGTAVVLLPTMLANYAGLPIRTAAPPLALALLCGSLVVISRFPRPHLPRWYILVGVVLAAALFLNAWPMFVFDSDWLSFTNTDMQTYVHTATNMFGAGFLSPPDGHAYIDHRAFSSTYDIRAVLLNRRSGSENLLAFWMSLSGRDGYRTYMPLIMAVQVALIAAATALVCDSRRGGHVPVATSLILACSPLMALGVDHQLLPQVLGIALLIAALVMLCRPVPIGAKTFFSMAALTGCIVAAYAAVYPETAVFFVIAVFLFYALAIARRTVTIANAAAWIAASAAVALLAVNVHVTTVLQMIALTFSFSTGSVEQWSAFTAYLIPSGLADLFGFAAVSWTGGQALVFGIVAGAALLLISLFAMAVLLTRGRIVAFGLLAMSLSVPMLFMHQNGFGLYKLAMYIQPFLIPTLLLWWADPVPPAPAPAVSAP